MRELLSIGLFLAGLGLVALVLASLWIPKALRWKEKLSGLTPLMRELWWTYSLYIWGSHCFFAFLALGQADWLLSGSPAAAAVSGFICLWWSVRVYLQFFGFDFEEVEDTLINRLAKGGLTLLFLYLTGLFGILFWWNVGGAE
jgi:hypothetical protein